MLAEIGHDEIGERDDPTTRLGLGRPEGVAAADQVVNLPNYPDGASVKATALRAVAPGRARGGRAALAAGPAATRRAA